MDDDLENNAPIVEMKNKIQLILIATKLDLWSWRKASLPSEYPLADASGFKGLGRTTLESNNS